MSKIIATIYLFGMDLTQSVQKRLADRPERGSVTMEQVVITAAVLLAAIAVVGVITNVINDRASAIV